MSSQKIILIGALLFSIPMYSLAASNVAKDACVAMAGRTSAQLDRMKAHSEFWSRAETREIYIIALHGGELGVNKFVQRHPIDLPDRTAIVMAAIATRDLPLMKSYYHTSVEYFAIRVLNSNPLVWSSMCNFTNGTKLLLRAGVDPNEYPGSTAGPFNMALLHSSSLIPQLLLDAGYNIGYGYRTCKASKFILARHHAEVLPQVAGDIQRAVCKG